MTAKDKIGSFSTLQELEIDFTIDHIHDIRSAVVYLLDVIATIIDKRQGVAQGSYQSLSQDVINLNENVFKGVHDRYLWWCSTYGEKRKGNNSTKIRTQSAKMWPKSSSANGFTLRYSKVEADRFLKTLMTAFDSCRAVLVQSLKRRSQRETILYGQLTRCQDDLQRIEIESSFANKKLDDVRRERDAWNLRFDEMKQKLEESERTIEKLEKCSNMLKWQQLQDELESKHEKEIDCLKQHTQSEQNQFEQNSNKLKERIKKLENDIGCLKLKQKLPYLPTSNGLMEKLDHTKRELFLKDQEIYMLQKEIHQQRQLMTSCMNGLQQDFRNLLLSHSINDAPGKKFNPDSKTVRYQAMLRYIQDECAKENWKSLQENLPPPYKSTNPGQEPSTKSKVFTGRTLSPSLPKSSSNSPVLSRRSKTALKNPSQGEKSSKETSPAHPQLVSKVTGRANLLQIMKHFPYLTMEQVTKQWENFRKYDKNNDYSLDLPELYEVITQVLEIKITIEEMKEAMYEVDRDESNNIDFYEYLKISEMIFKKQGNAAVFQSDILLKRGLSSSQDCILQ